MSSEQISDRLGLSAKTVHRYIEHINRYLQDSQVEIVSMRGYGFVIQGNVKKIENLILNLNRYDSKIKDMALYLVSKEYITIEEIGIKLAYSASMLNKQVPEVKKYLSLFGLRLKAKPYYGMCVIGNELNIRDLLIDCGFRENQYGEMINRLTNIDGAEFLTIKRTVIDFLQSHNIIIADADAANLIMRIAIIVSRCRQDCLLDGLDCIMKENLVQQLLFQTAKNLNIIIPPSEVSYLSMYFDILDSNLNDSKSEEDITVFVTDALEKLQKIYRNLEVQPQIKESLILHLTLMFNRLSHKHFVKNGLLQDIKANYTLEMNYAITFGKMIKEHYSIEITEDELGYLALYFALSSRPKKVKRVIIMCHYGIATSQLIKEQIQDKFPDLEIVGIYPLYYLEVAVNQDIDLMISTVALDPKKVKKPFIVINQILNEDTFTDIKKLIEEPNDNVIVQYLRKDAFFILSSASKEEALKDMADRLIAIKSISPETVKRIYERESISSTDIGNLVALPHALIGDNEESIIGIAILKKPIQWDKEKVQVIFMIALSKKDAEKNNIFRGLYRIVKDVSKVNYLIDSKSFDAFTKLY